MDKQIIEEILKRIQLLEKVIEPYYVLGIDYKIWALIIPLIAVMFSLVIAVGVPFLVEHLRRKPRKSNLVIMNKSVNPQGDSFVGRLIITNDSEERAVNVEAYIESIVYNDKPIKDYLPIPLRWTHGHVYNSEIRRDIFGKQTVYLDIFHYQEERGENIPVIEGLNKEDLYWFKLQSPITTLEYCNLKSGKTKLHIKLYQESGQVREKDVEITWEKKGDPPKLII
ncbi:MAG: hypothetical protein WCD80_07995 [Desulfobaccales bacterium]